MLDLKENTIIRKLELEPITRYRTVNNEKEDTTEVDMLNLKLYLGGTPNPFNRSEYIVNVNLFYINYANWLWIKNNINKIMRNLESKLLHKEINSKDIKAKVYKQYTKFRLSPKITKEIRKIVLGTESVCITEGKYFEMKMDWYQDRIKDTTWNKYQKPIIKKEILLQ
jgi:hypothetical protein